MPKFKVHGGSEIENLALQNVQARCRMVLSYFYAQLIPWTQGESAGKVISVRSAMFFDRDVASFA